MEVIDIEKPKDGCYYASIRNGFMDYKVPFLANAKTGHIAISEGFSKKMKEHIAEWIRKNGLPESNGGSVQKDEHPHPTTSGGNQ